MVTKVKKNTTEYVKLTLDKGKFFKFEKDNKLGQELLKYLTRQNYYDILNPDPCDSTKNTISKLFVWLAVIETEINKPFDEITSDDFFGFIERFSHDDIIISNGKPRKKHLIKRYVSEFKRLMRIDKTFKLNNDIPVDSKKYNWIENLKAPKVKTTYEKYPYLSVEEMKLLADSLLPNHEYKIRCLLSLNLMARKCEASSLTFNDLEFREDGIFVQLPDIKKYSSDKVAVQLYSFVERDLQLYLKLKNIKGNELLFPSSDVNFANRLRKVSKELFNQSINPKTLRKLGVCLAEQLGKGRDDVERIGGWSANSLALNHYFNRKGVSNGEASKIADNKLNSNIVEEMEKLRIENLKMRQQMNDFNKALALMEKI